MGCNETKGQPTRTKETMKKPSHLRKQKCEKQRTRQGMLNRNSSKEATVISLFMSKSMYDQRITEALTYVINPPLRPLFQLHMY